MVEALRENGYEEQLQEEELLRKEDGKAGLFGFAAARSSRPAPARRGMGIYAPGEGLKPQDATIQSQQIKRKEHFENEGGSEESAGEDASESDPSDDGTDLVFEQSHK